MKVTIYNDEKSFRIRIGKILLFIIPIILILSVSIGISGNQQNVSSIDSYIGYFILTFLSILVLQLYLHFSLWFPYPKNGYMEIENSRVLINGAQNGTIIAETLPIQVFDRINIWSSQHLFNRITLKLGFQHDNEIFNYTIRLTSKSQNEQFKSLLSHWYKQKINIYEYDSSGLRVFLLKSHLTYKDIQNIKNEYQIDWQYDQSRINNQYV